MISVSFVGSVVVVVVVVNFSSVAVSRRCPCRVQLFLSVSVSVCSSSPLFSLPLPGHGLVSRVWSRPQCLANKQALDHQMVRACPRHSSHAAATPRIVALHRPPPAKTAPQTSKYRPLYLYLTSRPFRSLQISPRTCHFHSRKLPYTVRTRGRDFLPPFLFFRKENFLRLKATLLFAQNLGHTLKFWSFLAVPYCCCAWEERTAGGLWRPFISYLFYFLYFRNLIPRTATFFSSRKLRVPAPCCGGGGGRVLFYFVLFIFSFLFPGSEFVVEERKRLLLERWSFWSYCCCCEAWERRRSLEVNNYF